MHLAPAVRPQPAPPPPVRASDVVAYLLARRGPMQQLKLQKLLYYCQAWRLAYGREPLFGDRIEAWAAGPVVPNVWHNHRYEYMVEREPDGDVRALSHDQRADIDAVLDSYFAFSGNELSELTHKEKPWRDARVGVPDRGRSGQVISPDAMAEYYGARRPDAQVAAVAAV